ncbi:hypothetical protein ZWY2020_031645 [Hordeum vulgare]|nr:hypothetical protein ZWY2020_031645 [Hordeum vulgare]
MKKPTPAPRSGSGRVAVVPMLLVFCLAYVLGLVSNATFLNNILSPLLMPAPRLPATTEAVPCILPPLPPPEPTPPPPPPPTPSSSPERRRMESDGAMHNMNDEELLWRASMVPRITSTPKHGIVPKVAFLFLVRGDVPLRPLWDKFFEGHEGLYSIYVHTSPDYTGSPPPDSPFYGRIIPSQRTSWGNINLMDAERRLLGNALLDVANARFALLSESCIPILGFPALYAYLTGANTSFVDSFDRRDGRARHRQFFTDRNISLAQWRKGAQWFEMDRALALEVASDETYYGPVFRNGKHGVRNLEEHYPMTLASLLGWGARNANRTVTYSDWRHPVGQHPKSHNSSDVTVELFQEMRRGYGDCYYNGGAAEVCAVFARKFKPEALHALLDLAPKLFASG